MRRSWVCWPHVLLVVAWLVVDALLAYAMVADVMMEPVAYLVVWRRR